MPGATGRSGGDRKTQGMDLFPRDGVPEPPQDLGDAERKVWHEYIQKIPAEMLRGVDGIAQFRILCECTVMQRNQYARLRRDPMDKESHKMYMQTIAHIHKLSSHFGLTPRDRQAIKFEREIIDDASEWMNEG